MSLWLALRVFLWRDDCLMLFIGFWWRKRGTGLYAVGNTMLVALGKLADCGSIQVYAEKIMQYPSVHVGECSQLSTPLEVVPVRTPSWGYRYVCSYTYSRLLPNRLALALTPRNKG